MKIPFYLQRIKPDELEDPDMEIFDQDEDYDPSFDQFDAVRNKTSSKLWHS